MQNYPATALVILVCGKATRMNEPISFYKDFRLLFWCTAKYSP